MAAALGIAFVAQATDCLAAGSGEILPSITARNDRVTNLRPTDVPPDEELESTHATIGDIIIDVRQIFDTSKPEEDTTLFRLGNKLHIRTRDDTIRSQLLFAHGAAYSRRELDESERILRRTRYLYDAQIYPVAYHDGVVDVKVTTRDVWTLNPGISFGRTGGKNSAGIELEELNFLGLGTQLQASFKSNVDRETTSLLYRDNQILGTWWSGMVRVADNSDGDTRELALDHPFYSLDTRRAGGVFMKLDDRVDSLYDLGKITDQYRTQQDTVTAYVGLSAGLDGGWSRRWTTGVTYDSHRFDLAPDPQYAGFVPPDRILAYPWIGYEIVQDEFETARNRDQIERTEDVLLGWRARLQLGWSSSSWGANRDALVVSGFVNKGLEPDRKQRLLFAATLDGRIEGGDAVDTVLGASARYYARQSDHRLFYAGLETQIGANLDPDHQILLGGDNGLRGYPLRYQGGEGSWLATVEQRYFTNWYPFRLFHVGGAIFADAGETWGSNPRGAPSQGVLKDVGFGLRLGNSRSGLGNMLHVDLAFPLDGDSSIDKVQLLIETKASF
jgi:outer membrane protein assembly factor BamA